MGLVENEFIKFMEKFDAHPFEIVLNGEKHRIGEGEPEFSVTFHKTPSLGELMESTSIALGDAYMNGDIEVSGSLYHVLNLFLGQMGKFSTDQKKLKNLIFSSSSKKNQKKEVSSHYDIGNDFYKLWLDETMSYSCGYFRSEEDSLCDAQRNKVNRTLEKLYLKEGMTLCDIGCGWGYLLIQAAKKYKVRGVGITLSEEQKKEGERRIREEHLEGYVEIKLLDYRDLPDLKLSFDRVVSIGMIEHVGRDHYETFMKCVKSVLKPGGVVPSLREILHIAGDQRFYTLDVESWRRHYNRTLLCWNENFQKHRGEAVKMFDERFARMWELYLCACAATFMNGIIDLHQILFTNDVNNELPMVRWY